jgi:hypothetical protein
MNAMVRRMQVGRVSAVALSLLVANMAPADMAGQVNLRAGYNALDSDNVLADAVGESYTTASAELRLMPEFRRGNTSAALHYELIALRSELPGAATGLPLAGVAWPDDDTRVFDLTHVLSRQEEFIAYHRLDRLAFTHSAGWGSLTVGREAVTWGNGLVFNPMDLFNPFAPTDVQRDFKVGDDLVLLSLSPGEWNRATELQLLVVPRRPSREQGLRASESSFALKAHRVGDSLEWDLMAALHYDEPVIGFGTIGNLGMAVWRWDATLTFATDGHRYFSTVTNIDYSWNWKGLNYYGSLEFHYNTIGSTDYDQLWENPPLLERLARGEMHTIGRCYLSGALQVELHPLLNLHLLAICNLLDPSAALLPRLVWSVRQDLELTAGASLNLGGSGTEFGGLPLPGGSGELAPSNQAYLWLTAYF